MVENVTKSAFSLEGWNFWEWFKGNGKTIKETLKWAVPAAIGWVTTSNPELTVVATLFGKFVLDVADYYLKEKTA